MAQNPNPNTPDADRAKAQGRVPSSTEADASQAWAEAASREAGPDMRGVPSHAAQEALHHAPEHENVPAPKPSSESPSESQDASDDVPTCPRCGKTDDFREINHGDTENVYHCRCGGGLTVQVKQDEH